jgi:AbiU2
VNNPKDKLEEYLDKILRTVWDLNSNLFVIKFLRDLNNQKKRDAYNVVSNFFSFVNYSALTNLVLTIDRLFEKPKQSSRSCKHCNNIVSEISYGERSLIWYLTQLRTHSTSFPEPKRLSKEIDKQIKSIQNESEVIKKIGLYRDKWFAHRDKKYFDNPQKIWDENPLLFEDLEK